MQREGFLQEKIVFVLSQQKKLWKISRSRVWCETNGFRGCFAKYCFRKYIESYFTCVSSNHARVTDISGTHGLYQAVEAFVCIPLYIIVDIIESCTCIKNDATKGHNLKASQAKLSRLRLFVSRQLIFKRFSLLIFTETRLYIFDLGSSRVCKVISWSILPAAKPFHSKLCASLRKAVRGIKSLWVKRTCLDHYKIDANHRISLTK